MDLRDWAFWTVVAVPKAALLKETNLVRGVFHFKLGENAVCV
jgi:hypothetical protein